jgi:hypothetical protein
MFKSEDRYYEVNGQRYPSVTTCISILNKPALLHWAVNQERKAFQEAMLEVLTGPHSDKPEEIWKAVEVAVKGVKEHVKVAKKAADIGTQMHAWIAWYTRNMLPVTEADDEPPLSDEAKIGVEAWRQWADKVDFRPYVCEYMVYHRLYNYAGTMDVGAYIEDIPTTADYKSSSAFYPEMDLQLEAYESGYNYMLDDLGLDLPRSKQKMIIRLPKTIDQGPEIEIKVVKPDKDRLGVFISALELFEWTRNQK